MTAINVVRFRVRPGMDEVFLNAHRDRKADRPRLDRGLIVATGDRGYVLVGEWPDAGALAGARGAHDREAQFVSPCARRPGTGTWRHRCGLRQCRAVVEIAPGSITACIVGVTARQAGTGIVSGSK